MGLKFKYIAIFEFFIIAILLVFLIYALKSFNPQNQKESTSGLLSPRIYSGLLKPESFMIVNFAELKEKIQSYVTKNNLNVSVYVENFRNGAYMGINEKNGFFPASLIKLPVAILITKKIEDGKLSFDTMLEIEDSDRTSSYGELYKTEEKQLPVRILLEKMMKESDNTAFRVLLHEVDVEDFQLVLDYYNIEVNADFQDGETAKHPNLLSPKAMSTLFSSLYFSTVLEPDNSEYLLSLLSDSAFNVGQAANIPNHITIAHKFGETHYGDFRYFHDCGIIYINESRVFYCIMTKDLDEKQATEAIGSIVNEIYNYVKNTRAKLDKYKYKDED